MVHYTYSALIIPSWFDLFNVLSPINYSAFVLISWKITSQPIYRSFLNLAFVSFAWHLWHLWHLCHFLGIFLAFSWHLLGICLAFAWHLWHVCHLFGICLAFAWHLWHVCHLFGICGIGLAFVSFICGSFLSLLWSDERSPTCGSFLSSDERKKQRHSGAGLKMYNVHPLESKERKK